MIKEHYQNSFKIKQDFINNDNLLLQNYRPPNDFHDFTSDYKNNNIKLINNGLVIVNRFYKNYYNNYLETNHYGKLFNNKEVYYKNIICINGLFKIMIYPNTNSDIFNFKINTETKQLIIENMKNTGWKYKLKIVIINEKNMEEYLINVEKSESDKKIINLSFL